MRSTAQIDERTASVDGRLGALGHTLVDKIFLVLAVLEHLEQLCLGHFKTDKGLLLLDDGIRNGFESLFVLLSNGLTVYEGLVKENHHARISTCSRIPRE